MTVMELQEVTKSYGAEPRVAQVNAGPRQQTRREWNKHWVRLAYTDV